MEQANNKKRVGLTILKVLSIIVLVIVIIFVSGYLYIKYYLGFDISKFKRAINLK